MDIEKIKAKKEELEIDIRNLVSKFIKDTGVTPSDVSIRMINAKSFDGQRMSAVGEVRVRFEL